MDDLQLSFIRLLIVAGVFAAGVLTALVAVAFRVLKAFDQWP